MENFICYFISDYWVRQVESGMVSEVESGNNEANEARMVGIWLSGGSNIPGSCVWIKFLMSSPY